MSAKKYKIKPGILLLSADKEYMLATTKAGRDGIVPNIRQINEAAAYYWTLYQSPMDKKEMAAQVAEHFGISKLAALIQISQFENKLKEMGYFIKEEEA